jgi:DNA-binding beta-propeller fold protein YncE
MNVARWDYEHVRWPLPLFLFGAAGRIKLRLTRVARALVIAAILTATVNAQKKLPLKLVATTPMPGYTGDLDHFGLDLNGNRLFLAAEDKKTVEVFDLRTGEHLRSIEGFGHPLTMAYLPRSNQLLVTNGDTDDVALVDCETYKIINTLKLGKNVDHSALNPIDDYFYVENGATADGKSHSIAIIDSKSFKVVGQIPGLSGDSNEGMVIDHEGKKLYVNMTGSDEVGVIDLETRKIVAKWPLPDVHVAHAIALDEPHHRLFTATRKPPQFVVFNTDNGKVVASLPCVGVNSDMSLDVARRRIYITGSDTASVFAQHSADRYEHIAEVPTAFRAKSSIFVPQLSRLYVADSGKGKPHAKLALQIFEAE